MRKIESERNYWNETLETERFCRMLDYFFDCLNTRNLLEAKLKRKPQLGPYFKPSDYRLKVSYKINYHAIKIINNYFENIILI